MSDQIIRDLPLIARRAQQDADANAGFREYLKLHLPLSNGDLDAVVRETTEAVWSQIDCTSCAACCRQLEIVVDEKDIRRLAAHRGMTPQAFATRYVALADDGVMHFATAPCSFLGDDGKCTVYEARPQACRDYPYLYDRHFRSRSLTMLENVPACPIVFNVWERLKVQLAPSQPVRKKRR